MLRSVEPAPPSIDRFALGRELGRGGMGVVYAATDGATGEAVALKVLRGTSAQHVMLLKNEFRALADLQHRNLVSLRELHADADRVFITMELLDGCDLLASLRGATADPRSWVDGSRCTLGFAPDDTLEVPGESLGGTSPAPAASPLSADALDRLRELLAQVAEGLHALHAARRLHRDVKPSNVLVTPEGRAVLLDFGLVAELREDGVSLEDGIAGSVPYMAPEQAAGGELGPAADWYAFGAMLYEALVGHPPFTGAIADVFRAKQNAEPVPPSQRVGPVPTELEALCLALLRRDPAQRPDDAEVLAALGRSRLAERASSGPRSQRLVGREEPLAALAEALATVRQGRAATVHVRARSGLGKSALVGAFLDGVDGARILRARCFERDSVPFKALDPLVDQLARWLVGQPPDVTAGLVPRYPRELLRLFPVLGQVAALARGGQRTAEAADPREQRRRAFSGLRELLVRLAELHTVIVHLDDLQWGDLDSGELLMELTRLPDPPSLLLIASYRSENQDRSPMLRRLHQDVDADTVRTVDLAPLDRGQALRLAEAILAERGVDPDAIGPLAETVVDESAGSPFFVTELAWRGLSGGARLDAMLREKADELDPDPRGLIEAIALLAVPVTRRSALRIAGVTARQTEALAALGQGRFVRGDGPGLDDLVECYHDRVREAVASALPDERRRGLHERIAEVLEEAGEGDAELLTEHYLLAGRHADAARQARRAAEQAEQAWAFDRAAVMIRLLLELEARTEEARLELLERLAEALKHGGRGREAAVVYEQAAELTEGPTRWRNLGKASNQNMWFGEFHRGREQLFDVAAELGLRLPRSTVIQVLLALGLRIRTRLRGIRRREHEDDDVPILTQERIELLLFAGFGSIITDQFLAFYLLSRAVQLALQHGTRRQQVLALAAESFICQLEPAGKQQSKAAYAAGEQLAERIGDSQGLSFACMYRGVALVQLGQWSGAEQAFGRALQLNEQQVKGGAALAAWTRMFLAAIRFSEGRLHEGHELYSIVVNDARSRGDVGLEVHTRLGIYFRPLLLAGDPDRDERGIDECLALLDQPEGSFDLMQFYALIARAQVWLYRGRTREVLDLLRSHRRQIRRSGALSSGVNVALHHHVLGLAALAVANEASGRERRSLLRLARSLSRKLRAWGENGPFYEAILGAGARLASGEREGALDLLDRAERSATVRESPLMAGCLACLRAHHDGDADELEAVQARLAGLGVVEPEAWLRTWVTPLDPR